MSHTVHSPIVEADAEGHIGGHVESEPETTHSINPCSVPTSTLRDDSDCVTSSIHNVAKPDQTRKVGMKASKDAPAAPVHHKAGSSNPTCRKWPATAPPGQPAARTLRGRWLVDQHPPP